MPNDYVTPIGTFNYSVRINGPNIHNANGSILEDRIIPAGGYTSLPTVVITGGGGSGASALAVLKDQKIKEIIVTNGGSGYTEAPKVSFVGGGGWSNGTMGYIQDGMVVGIPTSDTKWNYQFPLFLDKDEILSYQQWVISNGFYCFIDISLHSDTVLLGDPYIASEPWNILRSNIKLANKAEFQRLSTWFNSQVALGKNPKYLPYKDQKYIAKQDLSIIETRPYNQPEHYSKESKWIVTEPRQIEDYE